MPTTGSGLPMQTTTAANGQVRRVRQQNFSFRRAHVLLLPKTQWCSMPAEATNDRLQRLRQAPGTSGCCHPAVAGMLCRMPQTAEPLQCRGCRRAAQGEFSDCDHTASLCHHCAADVLSSRASAGAPGWRAPPRAGSWALTAGRSLRCSVAEAGGPLHAHALLATRWGWAGPCP